jgi:magnesium-transporting ATPase (P-type)
MKTGINQSCLFVKQVSVHVNESKTGHFLVMKGAPEKILER